MNVTFETAALAGAVAKAAIVAPGHGAAFDKANGVVLDLDSSGANGWHCLLRSTNLDIFRIEWLDPETIEGGKSTWRLPAQLFSKFLAGLPIGPGKVVTIEEHANGMQKFIRIKSGRAVAKFNLIDAALYPDWAIFDPAQLTQALDVGGRIGQVEWAADKSGEAPFAGVHFDGERIVATDRYRMATVPLEIPGLVEPITVPSGLLSQLLKQTGEIQLGVSGGQLLLMPDESIQIRCVLFGNAYPATTRIRETTYDHEFKIKKDQILELLNRAASYAASDRDSVLNLYIGEEELAVFTTNGEVGSFGDAIEIPGQATHDRHQIKFTPKNIVDPISNAPSSEVVIGYDLSSPDKLVRVDGGSGYYAWGMPRKSTQPDSN